MCSANFWIEQRFEQSHALFPPDYQLFRKAIKKNAVVFLRPLKIAVPEVRHA